MNACLSEYALDNLVLNGDCSPEGLTHLQTCHTCQQRREARRTQAEEFESTHAESFWKRVQARHRQRRRSRFTLTLAIPSALAMVCAVIILVVYNRSPLGVYVGAKGSSFVEIYCHRAGKTFALHSQDSVQAGDALRFVPRPSSPKFRYVQIASIDGRGRYTPFYPADFSASSIPLPAPGEPLDGSIRLDNSPGPERLFFVFSAEPLPVPIVQPMAKAQGADLVPAQTMGGTVTESGWIVLSKRAGPSEGR